MKNAKSFTSLIILLFFFSILSPSVTGYNNRALKEFLDDLIFDCYDVISYTKLSYLGEYSLKFLYDDDIETDKIEFFKESNMVKSTERAKRKVSVDFEDNALDSPWPMKCHDLHHTSRSPYSTADNNGDELWRFKTDKWIEGGPIIDEDGIVYFGSFDGYLYAVYPDSSLKWKHKIGGWIWSTPAIGDDGTVYVGSDNDYFYAINPDGTRKWTFCAWDSISSSPAIASDGTIYFGSMGDPEWDGCKIFALNPDGTVKWNYATGYKIASSPAIADDDTIYIGSGDGYLYAMNPDGTLKWRYKTNDEIHGDPSIADDGTIYFSSFDKYLYALFPNGTLKWQVSGGGSYVASASIAEDGTIYSPGNNYLYAIYPNNGTRKWSFKLYTSDCHIGRSSPAIGADGTIYVGTHNDKESGGDIIAINPDGTEKWRKRIANKWVESSPCIGRDGTVYIGSSSSDMFGSYGYLHCFVPGNNSPPNRPMINGPINGRYDTNLDYSFVAVDPDGDDIYLWIDWGDEQVEQWKWLGPYPSGQEQIFSHKYEERGTYELRVKAKDSYVDSESDWTTLTVTMPKSYNLLSRFPLLEKLWDIIN